MNRPLLGDKEFLLKTDSRALQWLAQYKDERAKLTRYALLLQEFKFKVEHCPGRINLLPDFLSRNPADEEMPPLDEDRILLSISSSAPDCNIGPTVLNDLKKEDKERRPRKKGYTIPSVFMQPITMTAQQLEVLRVPLYDRVQAQQKSPEYAATQVRIRRLQSGEDLADEQWKITLRDKYRVDEGLVWYIGENVPRLVVLLNL